MDGFLGFVDRRSVVEISRVFALNKKNNIREKQGCCRTICTSKILSYFQPLTVSSKGENVMYRIISSRPGKTKFCFTLIELLVSATC